MDKYIFVLCVCIYSLFTNIARVSSMALNTSGLGALVLGSTTYRETPLHNLNDVADLGVESSGTRRDRLQELEEILEDESQSPDEQSASKYEENVKVFDNPAVLEATSHPTDDEVKDFQKVSQHELATRDDHFDTLNSLIPEKNLLNLVDGMLKRDRKNKESPPKPPSGVTSSPPEKTKLHFPSLKGELDGLNAQSEPDSSKESNHGFSSGPNGLNTQLSTSLGKQLGLALPNPLDVESQKQLLRNLQPIKVKARTRNHFHVLNVHHHYPQPPDSTKYPENVKFAQGFLTKECFEGGSDGQSSSQNCYCSRSETCRCTKTYMMLVSMCDTLVNDPYVKEFCSHHDLKRDHPNLNHRFAKSKDNAVSDAFNAVHAGMCNYKSFGYCKNILEMEKLCQCTKCD